MVNGRRLIPRWFACLAILLPLGVALAMVGVALASDGVSQWLAGSMAVVLSLLTVAALSAFASRRRERILQDGADGVVIDCPHVLVYSLVAAWLGLLVVAGLSAYLLVTDFDAIESPGFTIILVIAACLSLPDLVRLVTGRLHRWRIRIRPDAVTYQGYRTSTTIPWSKLHQARIQERGPAGVLLDRKGTGPDPVIPIVPFRLPAAQVMAEIELARRRWA